MRTRYQMWMTYDGGEEKLRFPMLPSIVHVRQGMKNQSVSIQGLGELGIMQDPSAMMVNFACFFPAIPFPGTQLRTLTPPMELVEKITEWMEGDLPVQFMITGTPINSYFTIENFPWHEKGGDPGTLHYMLSLKEYTEVIVRQINVDEEEEIATIPEPAPVRVDNRTIKRTHKVAPGDTMWAIAQRLLGSGARWQEIARLNGATVSNPNLILPGQVLRLPT